MQSLIPAENWEYSLRDIITGFSSAVIKNQNHNEINIEGIGRCIPSRSARASIYTAIQVLNLPRNARIGVPLYCCPVVFKAIEATGCRPCFIDIEFETCCMSVKDLTLKRNDLDAVIVVHMFGNTCDMPELLDVVQGKPIIEDCAQSLGSSINGSMTGTFGTIAAFSFRSGKYLTAGEGGALFSNQQILMEKLTEEISKLPVPGLSNEFIHLAKTYLRTKLRTKPLYGLVGYPLWQYYNKTVDYSAKTPIIISQSYFSDQTIAIKRLKSLKEAIEKQRAYADYYTRTLKLDPGMICMEKPGAYYNRYLYPIIFQSSSQRDRVAVHLHKDGIGTAKPYHDIAAVAAKHYSYRGDCPVSEQVADRILVIPIHYNLNNNSIKQIALSLNNYWNELRE